MERLQAIIIICVIGAFGFLGAKLMIYWDQNRVWLRRFPI